MFIEVDHLSFAYGEKTVFNNLSWNLAKGQSLAIAGASGCGKSTLLKAIAGLLTDQKNHKLTGRISIGNQEPQNYVRDGRLSFMFQEPALLPNLSVRKNIALPLEISGVPDPEKVEKLIKAVGLVAYADFLPGALSGGMKTRVALARSFITNPQLLLLDEPFAALDIGWKRQLYLELQQLRHQFETTVVFVTHDVQEAVLLADQIIVLTAAGQICANHVIKTNRTVMDRLQDISGYLQEVYTAYLLPVQDAILNDKQSDEKKAVDYF